jgi:hypothetical protein
LTDISHGFVSSAGMTLWSALWHVERREGKGKGKGKVRPGTDHEAPDV